jgi:hypothetical protein
MSKSVVGGLRSNRNRPTDSAATYHMKVPSHLSKSTGDAVDRCRTYLWAYHISTALGRIRSLLYPLAFRSSKEGRHGDLAKSVV